VDQGIRGFAELAGIPGTVGGAIAMNASAWGTSIGDRVEELEVMDRTGRTQVLRREMLRFSYRSVDLPPGSIIVAALLRGEESSTREVKDEAKIAYRKRKDSQPVRDPAPGACSRTRLAAVPER
jgi:UDP-N-acetylmuramate dehydrogenase